MPETIREHLKRRGRLSLMILVIGAALMLVILWVEGSRHRVVARVVDAVVLVATGAGVIGACISQRCPGCGRWFTRTDYSRSLRNGKRE